MSNLLFFKKATISKKVYAGGPSSEAQLLAMVKGDYWTVLNSDILILTEKDKLFRDRANGFKHALQTYGPSAKLLPDLRQNEGKIKTQAFHGHVRDSNGTTYILEWAIIHPEKKIMALIGFAPHENYKFRTEPLTDEEINKIMSLEKNKQIIENVPVKIQEAKNKFMRVLKPHLHVSIAADKYLKV